MIHLNNISLLQYNTFGIDVQCSDFYEYESICDAITLCKDKELFEKKVLLLGGGSNILLTKDFEGSVFHSKILGIEKIKEDVDFVYLKCGSGEEWDKVVNYCVSRNYSGAENLSLIPGEVGASCVQNIGAYGAEIKDLVYEIEAVEISSAKLRTIKNIECQYSYRYSKFKGEWKDKFIITHVTYRLKKEFSPLVEYGKIKEKLEARNIVTPTIQDLRNVVIEIRKEKLPDPKEEGNAGSFFMNPIISADKFLSLQSKYPQVPHYVIDDDNIKIPAGWMIEQCGWKGKQIGAVGVHAKQALVLVNKGGACGMDILNLCDRIIADVHSKFGVMLYPEVNIL